MKVLVVLVAILVTVAAQVGRPDPQIYAPIPYSFAYTATGEEGGSSSHQETSDGSGKVTGSYTVNDIDGRNRVVEYIADEAGFRAIVRSNEPGTDNSSPADVVFESTSPDAKGPIIRYSNEAAPRPPTASVSGGRQGVRYVLVPSTDPRATGYQ